MSIFRPSYDASSRADIGALVTAMRSLEDEDRIVGLVAVHAGGLMLPRGWLRLAMALVGLRGQRFKARFLLEMYKRDPAATLAMWEQTCAHVWNGNDYEDQRSVGGWSQREIDLFLRMMAEVSSDFVSAPDAPAPQPDREV